MDWKWQSNLCDLAVIFYYNQLNYAGTVVKYVYFSSNVYTG